MSSSSSSTFEPGQRTLSLLASCAPGLEPVLADELTQRGYAVDRSEPGGVAFTGDFTDLMRANLDLGTALQVLWRVARFNAHDFRELEKRLARVPFAALLPRGAHVRVRAFSRRSRLYHTGALAQRLRDAVETALAPRSEGPAVTLVLRLDRDRATLAIDTSGDPLIRRGYRLVGGPAPLRADLACALLRLAGYDGRTPLLDPMTGTGTLALEAVRLARGSLPGARRRFAFESLHLHDPDALHALHERTASMPELQAPVIARDRHAAALARAQRNAEHAGVRESLLWEVGRLSDASAIDSLSAPLLVANPPYGKRLGDERKLQRLYAALGRRARQLDAQLAFITSSPRLAASTGCAPQSALLTDLGGLKVRLYLARTAQAKAAEPTAPAHTGPEALDD